MIGGQVVDIESENKSIEKEKLDFIHMNKTAAMIIGCMRAGAIMGNACKDDLQNITKYAKNIGLAFQIVDDILDIVGDEKALGKPVGSDVENHKSTYPSLSTRYPKAACWFPEVTSFPKPIIGVLNGKAASMSSHDTIIDNKSST